MATRAPMVLMSGADEFLRERRVADFIEDRHSKGSEITWVDAADKGALRNELASGGGLLDEPERLIVVENPQKADLGLLEAHLKDDDGTTQLLLHHRGKIKRTTKFGKFIKAISQHHAEFDPPDPWDVQPRAVKFCMQEAKRRGKELPEGLAQAMVSVCGADLGYLSREIQKVCLLGEIDGVETLGQPQVKGGISRIAPAEIDTIIRALEAKDTKRLAKMLRQVRLGLKGDVTMQVCRWLETALMQWLPVVNFDHQGIEPEEAAGMLGKNKWYYERKLRPRTRSWDQAGVVRLIRAVAGARRAVLDGHVAPWLELETGLIEACSGGVR